MSYRVSPERFTCRECGKAFGRQEHLKRHAATHTKERQFKCEGCGKAFMRRDALRRHEIVHKTPGPTLLQRGARACVNCATAKVRCTGQNDGDRTTACSRCLQRSIQCRYPEYASVDRDSAESLPGLQRQSLSAPLPEPSPLATMEPPAQNRNAYGDLNMMSFDSAQWNDDILSNINWLPDDIPIAEFDNFNWSATDSQFWSDLPNIQAYTHSTTQEGLSSTLHPVDHPTVSTESPAASTILSNDGTASGEFYVDGNEARLPRVKRRRLGSSRSTGPKSAELTASHFTFADLPSRLSGHEQGGCPIPVPEHVYESLQQAFSQTCVAYTGRGKFFDSVFPTKELFEQLLRLYVDHFHPILPIFTLSALPLSSWRLVLVMSALGSHMAGESSGQFVLSIHEFAQRVLRAADDGVHSPSIGTTEMNQMRLLHSIGLVYCDDEIMRDHGFKILVELAAGDNRISRDKSSGQGDDPSSDWAKWKLAESAGRTAHAIWLLDCMVAFHFHRRPMLTMDHTKYMLPCHEKVWAATTAEEWSVARQKYSEPPILEKALQQLYIKKKLASDMGEFSRILIIHGIFRRTWEVEDYFRRPLSRWTPTAQRQLPDEAACDTPIWLPSVPTYTKWRNSACDCLDILHWSANAAIGAASGMEHPTVLHLHLARVVLLTPHKNIIRLVHYLIGDSQNGKDEATQDRQVIQRWATQDQYKARLAMIHAGVMFWHVRRFSANGFYEPSSVALAVLALWAFSAFSARAKSSSRTTPARQTGKQNAGAVDQHTDSSEEETYEIILLDRPTDDELVQQFVRKGHMLKANMNGVGDLYGERGAERVLIEGRKLLSTLSGWDIRNKWLHVFDKLVAVTRQQRRSVLGAIH